MGFYWCKLKGEEVEGLFDLLTGGSNKNGVVFYHLCLGLELGQAKGGIRVGVCCWVK